MTIGLRRVRLTVTGFKLIATTTGTKLVWTVRGASLTSTGTGFADWNEKPGGAAPNRAPKSIVNSRTCSASAHFHALSSRPPSCLPTRPRLALRRLLLGSPSTRRSLLIQRQPCLLRRGATRHAAARSRLDELSDHVFLRETDMRAVGE
jgi:hypothetical protein